MMVEPNLIALPDPDEPTPILEPAATPAVTPAPTEPVIGASPEEDLADIEPEVVTVQSGQRLVPVTVLAAERRKAREAKEALHDTEQRFTTLIAAIREAKTKADAQVAPPGAPVVDPLQVRAARIAKTLDLYDRDGLPDIARARAFIEDQDAEVERRLKVSLGPEIATRQTERSTTNFKRAVAHAKGRGVAVDEQILQQLWNQFPPEITSDERAASVILAAAASYDKLFGPPSAPAKAPVTKPNEPLVVETPTERAGSIRLSPSQKQAARMVGVSEKEFAKVVETMDFSKTGSVVLED